MVFYLGYVLQCRRWISFPAGLLLGVHSFYKTGDTVATRSIAGETLPTKQKLLEPADPGLVLQIFI